MPFQSRPTRKSVLACDCELRVAEAQPGNKDLGVRGLIETWMKLSDPLRYSLTAGGMVTGQVFCLMLEMIEIWICRETFYRHDELSFVYAQVRINGQKVSSQKKIVSVRWTSVLSADRMRPLRFRDVTTI